MALASYWITEYVDMCAGIMLNKHFVQPQPEQHMLLHYKQILNG